MLGALLYNLCESPTKPATSVCAGIMSLFSASRAACISLNCDYSASIVALRPVDTCEIEEHEEEHLDERPDGGYRMGMSGSGFD